MNPAVHGLMLACLIAGLAVTVASCLLALRLRTGYGRLHAITPVTSVGSPLVFVALGLHNGWGLTTGLEILIAGLLAVTGPALEVATGRLLAQQEGRLSAEPTE
jgi:multicomponent Na+:H+ antiporter subunit G